MGVRGTVGALAVAVALTGCTSDEPPPTTLPPLSSASPSTSPSPSRAESSVPPAARKMTPEGAAAFARFFVESIGLAYQAAEPSVISDLSAEGCGGCETLIKAVAELRAEGERRVGGTYEVLAAVTPALEAGDAIVDVRYRRPAAEIVNADGVVTASAGPTSPVDAQVRVVWREGAWVVQGYRTFSS